MLAADAFGAIWFSLFFAVGVAMLVWNRRASEALIASQKAFADTLGLEVSQRWTDFVMRPRVLRAYTIVFAVVWLLICAAGIGAALFGNATHHHH